VIPAAFITEWANTVAWPTVEQVEQDLILSRLIIEIANDNYLGEELVFRGGTCLHKLRLDPALRYSEDLDYVRRSAGSISEIIDAIRTIANRLGMSVSTRIATNPKIRLRAPFESGSGTMSVKIEVNTYERSPAMGLERVAYSVNNQWYRGGADVQTFTVAELVATKIRALYQRSKGRDLFDLWLALTNLDVPPSDIVECFASYRPHNYTSALAEQNLRSKLTNINFRHDLDQLVTSWPADYDIDTAAEFVIDQLLRRIV
jgi:predicted nucleotidyltransferase component of viral defense system